MLVMEFVELCPRCQHFGWRLYKLGGGPVWIMSLERSIRSHVLQKLQEAPALPS